MLVMSRKKNESLVINNDITITVVEIRADKVRLGVVMPKEMSVHRQEVYDALHNRPSPTAPPASVIPPPHPSTAVPATQAPGAWLDRVVAVLRVRAGVSVDQGLLAQAILEVAVQELGTDLIRNAPPEQLKQALLQALQGNRQA